MSPEVAIALALTFGTPVPTPKIAAPTAPAAELWTLTTTYREADGHTHTCISGHTWDHRKNASHVCREWVLGSDGKFRPCGAAQFTQDSGQRPVSVQTFTRADSTVAETPADQSPVIRYTLPSSTSGCGPNGCPTTTYLQPTGRGLGLFRR